VFPAAETFFGAQPVFFQALRWHGPYRFDRDLRLDLKQGAQSPWEVPDQSPSPLDSLFDGLRPDKQ
jgi:hypothetical protein